mgnify:CR=1 FL=1
MGHGRSQKQQKRLRSLENKCASFEKLEAGWDDMMTICEMAIEENDDSMLPELQQEFADFTQKVESTRLSTLLTGEYDANNAILTFHAGAGGTEAQDWTQMLYRMYTRYCERMGFTVKLLDLLEGDEAGIKSVTFEVDGDHVYGYLRGEKGVHRLVRISPFDSNARRHTSFSSLDVAPMLEDEDDDIEIDMKDVRVDTYHSSGAGGQNVNKTSSAVRMTHYPTGIVVSIQDEKSQIKNRAKALRVLRSRLYEMEEAKKQKERSEARKNQVGSGDRSERIRTYNFPQNRLTDHRINLTLYKLDLIINGELDELLDALKIEFREQLLS